MPILKHAIKKMRVDERRSEVNKRIRTKMKSVIKDFKTDPSATKLTATFSAIDRAAKKRILPASRADRIKSRLSKLIAK
jgi:ribosomal protein S20